MTDFFRFPHTPHLVWLGQGEPRDDKVLSPVEADALLQSEIVVEEKLDDANLGFSVDPDGGIRAQNRGQYLLPPFGGQFARLDTWLTAHEGALFDTLEAHLIAFGEWCAAKHSLDYDALPDWWLAFDVYDRMERRFWSTERRDAWAQSLGLCTVQEIAQGRFALADLMSLLDSQRSRYRDGPLEGLVIRAQDDRWLNRRAKLVHPDFTQQIQDHWRRQRLVWNRLAMSVLAQRWGG
jgi:hypothetical protein